MKLKTELIRFDAQIAICQASIEQDKVCITVYGSAHPREAGNYPDLAQQRALQLVRTLVEQGLQGIEAWPAPTTPTADVQLVGTFNSAPVSPLVSVSPPVVETPSKRTSVDDTESTVEGSLPW